MATTGVGFAGLPRFACLTRSRIVLIYTAIIVSKRLFKRQRREKSLASARNAAKKSLR
jgi:hypothetical protein